MQLSRGRSCGYTEIDPVMRILVCSAEEDRVSEALVDIANSSPTAAAVEEHGGQVASTQPVEPAEEEMTIEERKAKRRR